MRSTTSLSLAAPLVLLIAACGGGTGSADGAAGSAGQAGAGGGVAGAGGLGGGGGSGGGDPACATAAANGTCAIQNAACGGPCTDVCQFCNLLICTGGRWQPMESAPAPCFACGPDGRCQTGVAYCDVVVGGALGSSPSYRCAEIPAACRSLPTCACLQGQGVPGSCAQAGPGALTVTLAAP